MKNVLFHAYASPKAIELCQILSGLSQKLYVTNKDVLNLDSVSNNIAEEDIDSLVLAFPDDESFGSGKEVADKILNSSFAVAKSFVQARIKKKFGQIICLVDSRANGMPYSSKEPLSQVQVSAISAQGGLVGLSKTIAKEYSKRGIINNVLYIDWQSIPLTEIASRIDSIFKDNTNMNGQVFALDGGKWL
jgi:NAD(P)-dependent dehydrogenase (short-subunit alcohol dehydrogenase family)